MLDIVVVVDVMNMDMIVCGISSMWEVVALY